MDLAGKRFVLPYRILPGYPLKPDTQAMVWANAEFPDGTCGSIFAYVPFDPKEQRYIEFPYGTKVIL